MQDQRRAPVGGQLVEHGIQTPRLLARNRRFKTGGRRRGLIRQTLYRSALPVPECVFMQHIGGNPKQISLRVPHQLHPGEPHQPQIGFLRDLMSVGVVPDPQPDKTQQVAAA
jgi:hypothetical protein